VRGLDKFLANKENLKKQKVKLRDEIYLTRKKKKKERRKYLIMN